MQELHTKHQLLELLSQGATVITPNNRLSAALLRDYFQYSAHRTVIKPRCLPYRNFIINVFEHMQRNSSTNSPTYLLNDAQCQHLWRMIIQADDTITYNEGLLHAVMNAWKQCQLWQINPQDPAFSYTTQTQIFQLWWQNLEQKLTQLNAISEHQLIPYLLKSPHKLSDTPIIWACFDEFTPQQHSLQSQLNEQGSTQYCYDLSSPEAPAQLFAAENNKEEYQQLRLWLQLKLQQGEDTIAVVVPDLQQEWPSLQRILSDHFAPELFNCTLGKALNEFPIVSHALSWLNLEHSSCTNEQATLILQSPYIGYAQIEFLQRSQYLQDSTLLKQQQCSLNSLSKQLSSSAPKLAELLKDIKAYPHSASPHEWVSLFQGRLNEIGFPGDYGLNSEQYQCHARFSTLLDEFRQLTLISPQLKRQEALDVLSQLAKNTVFQTQKNHAPIQVSGLLEASGCEFDSLWVMGLSDQCLPAKTQRSAFIPAQLQIDLSMPHSNASRELHFAQKTLQRLRRGCTNSLVFSYPQLQGDSPNLPCALVTAVPAYTRITPASAALKKSELLAMEEGYKITILSEEQPSGGTALLGNQAKCPFKAFAEHRLFAKALPQTTEGIDNKERGTIVHKIMELLWVELKSQHQLMSYSDTTLDPLINKAIEQALSALKEEHKLSPVVHDVEHTRLKRLILSCLAWEKQRPSFEVVALEQSYTINLSGLDIKLRVDRLDQVDDKKWVIDYKSSIPANKPWNEDRPQEPQLLLYALLNEEINALLFLQIKTGSILCSGLSEQKSDLKGVGTLKKEEDWDSTRNKWQQQLNDLAQEILNGHCPPKPINSALCIYCDFKNLCRID